MKLKYLSIVFLMTSAACAPNGGSQGTNPGNESDNQPGATGTTSGSTTTQTQGQSGAGPAVRYIGRVDSTKPVMSWPGTAVQTVFTGTKGTVTFTTKGNSNYVDVSVDGAAPTTQKVTNATPIAFGPVAQGTHTVTVTKVTESTYGALTLTGFNTDGAQGKTTLPSRRIEFIGDSITAGYGVLGTSPCTQTPAVESAAASYAMITASALKADASLIAWSGKGIARNVVTPTNTDTVTMAQLWTQTNAGDSTSVYSFPAEQAPQVVVINWGTNDFSYLSYDSTGNSSKGRAPIDQTSYVTAVSTLVQNVLSKYPDAQVVLCSSPMLSDSFPSSADQQHTTQLNYLQTVAAQVGSGKVHVLDLPTQQTGAGLNGCDAHPSKMQQQSMATALTAELKADLNW